MHSIREFLTVTLLLLFSVCAARAQSGDLYLESWPSEILFDRIVLLRTCQVDTNSKGQPGCDSFAQKSSDGPSILKDQFAMTELLEKAFKNVDFRREFVSWFVDSDPLARHHVGDFVKLYRKYAQAHKFSVKFDHIPQETFEIEKISAVLAKDRLDQYEYAYGKEVGRKVLKHFDAIHRQTFFENRTHDIDISVDFLKPIKTILTHLKLKQKFQWVFDNKLYFGYKSSFKHNKKVFIRFLGYYAKVSLDIELLRRRVYWWGYGEWEKVGITSKIIQEPVAMVGTEVKEI